MFEELLKRTRGGQTLRQEKVSAWMTHSPFTVSLNDSMSLAARIFSETHVRSLPVIDNEKKVVGILTASSVIRQMIMNESSNRTLVDVMETEFQLVHPDTELSDVLDIPNPSLLVVNEDDELVGMLTKSGIYDAMTSHLTRLDEIEHIAQALNIVLEVAYEGIVLVDAFGLIREFNEAYARFLGVDRSSVIGKPVIDVIENTRLHEVIKSGIPERGHIQVIQGQEMVVHRIPIWSNGKVIGAIGMLIFEGVTELYNILGRMQELSRHVEGTSNEAREKERGRLHITFNQVIGRSVAITELKRSGRRAARTPVTVLITGESGTGKEVLAKAIHNSSAYSSGSFVSINCAAIPEQLLEAELFGYDEGAFTGARKGGKPGKFELAHKGTLFLDEIGDMPLIMQAKILRVLEERTAERVGALKSYDVDARIIAATNRDLEDMVKKGLFREDLYYRLNIIRLHIPPLRERKEDIPLLLSYHFERLAREFDVSVKQLKAETIQLLMNYEWPGNIRELVNTVEVLLTMTEHDEIGLSDIPHRLHQKLVQHPDLKKEKNTYVTDCATDKPSVLQSTDIKSRVADHERSVIIHMLAEEHGNKAAVARKLGIHRSTLYEKIKKYKI